MPRSNLLQKFLAKNPDLETQIQTILDQNLSENDTREEIMEILNQKDENVLEFLEETVTNPLQILVLALKYDNFKGKMAVGKISSGKISKGQSVLVASSDEIVRSKVSALLVFDGLGLKEVEEAGCLLIKTFVERERERRQKTVFVKFHNFTKNIYAYNLID